MSRSAVSPVTAGWAAVLMLQILWHLHASSHFVGAAHPAQPLQASLARCFAHVQAQARRMETGTLRSATTC